MTDREIILKLRRPFLNKKLPFVKNMTAVVYKITTFCFHQNKCYEKEESSTPHEANPCKRSGGSTEP